MAAYVRHLAATTMLVAALLYFSSFAYAALLDTLALRPHVFPDISHHVHVRTLSDSDLGLDQGRGRVIVIGDIHGMNHSLHALLERLHYDPKQDTLVPAGDALTKSTDEGSLAVLSFLAQHNASAVLGNNDQPVVEWRAWQEWIDGLPPSLVDASFDDIGGGGGATEGSDGVQRTDRMSGEEWLASLDDRFALKKLPRKKWLARERERGPHVWWARVPHALRKDMFGDAYRIARAMTPAQYAYLRQLPLILHLPSLHTFIMHAGLLPYDTRWSPTHHGQPLARAPPLPGIGPHEPAALRRAQEEAIFAGIPQNRLAWTPLFLRTVQSDGSLSHKPKRGTLWAELWTRTMDRCAGYDTPAPKPEDDDVDDWDEEPEDPATNAKREQKGHSPLPCMPMTALYAHTAAFGLDVRRWSVGLDSGCVYGRTMSALVIDRRSLDTPPHKRLYERDAQSVFESAPGDGGEGMHEVVPGDEEGGEDGPQGVKKVSRSKWIHFGDNGSAQLVDVPCRIPKS